MAKRRGKNEGSIFQMPNGKWRAQVKIGTHRLSTTQDTKSACQKWVRTQLAQAGTGIVYDGAFTTFGEFCDRWLEQVRTTIRYNTFMSYRQQVDRLKLGLGKIKVKDLQATHIQAYFDGLVEEGSLSVSSLYSIYSILRLIVKRALVLRLTQYNPLDAVVLPKFKQREMGIWKEEDVSRFLGAVSDHRFEHLFHLELVTGMRLGEILGLRWMDVDWDRRILWVRKQVSLDDNGKRAFTDPKSEHGVRPIELTEPDMEHLRRQKARVDHLKRRAGRRWQELDLVFPNQKGGWHIEQKVEEDFYALLRLAGVPKIRFHDLRHTVISLQLSNGGDIFVVSRRAGHSRINITSDRYGHLQPGAQAEIANLMSGIVHSSDVTDEFGRIFMPRPDEDSDSGLDG